MARSRISTTGSPSPIVGPAPLQSNARHGRFRACPLCGGSVVRVRRRAIDRVTSLFHPVHRYRCYLLRCLWEGNLPADGVTTSRISS